MALFRRGKWWWTDFSVNGVRYRQPIRDEQGQRTRDWREALSREKELIAQAQAGKLSVAGQSFARLAFTEALKRYLEERKARTGTRSQKSEAAHAKPLSEFFGATPAGRISAEAILAYIRRRKEKGIGNVTVNMEIGILRRVLKRAKRWATVADEVPRLPERRDIGRALSHEEKVRLLRAAASRPEWEIARLAMILALNTTMRGCEIRGLQWRDIDFLSRTLSIRRSKTAAGERVIPLNADAMAAVLRLRERAIGLFGETRPDWYVFPSGEGQGPVIGSNHATVRPDPTRPRTAGPALPRYAPSRHYGACRVAGERPHDYEHRGPRLSKDARTLLARPARS